MTGMPGLLLAADNGPRSAIWAKISDPRLVRVEGLPKLDRALACGDDNFMTMAFGDAHRSVPSGGWLPSPPLNNLPHPVTSFVGRRSELTELRVLLQRHRMVTLVGAGGAGKSRLGLEFAREYSDEFVDGCWLVELASVSDPNLVPRTIASVIGVPEHPDRPTEDALAARLSAAPALIVLDNCEHLVGAVAAIASVLLDRCAGLRIIATSRERIGTAGEAIHHVRGLSTPDESADAAAIAGSDSTQLFIDRSRAVHPQPAASNDNAVDIARICRRLDGLPLAIELAASRTSSLSVDEIAARVDDQFALLTQSNRAALPHHRTLIAAVDWSYNLLSPAEREVFDSLAVFSGSFRIDDVRAVCGGGIDDRLAALVDKSLVVFDTTEEPNSYRLLETLRTYALAHVRQNSHLARLEHAHAQHFCAVAEAAAATFRGRGDAQWLVRLEQSHPNLRAALAWSVANGDAATATRIAGALPHFWGVRGHFLEGRRWLATVLAMSGEVDAAASAGAWLGVGELATFQNDAASARNALDRAAVIFRKLGSSARLARTIQYRALTALFADDLDEAETQIREALGVAQPAIDAGKPSGLLTQGWSLMLLAGVELGRQQYRAADRDAEAAERILRTVGDGEGISWTSLIRAQAVWRSDRFTDARTHAHRSLAAFHELGALFGLSTALFTAGVIAFSRFQPSRLAELVGACDALWNAMGTTALPFMAEWASESVSGALDELGHHKFDLCRREGAERIQSDRDGYVREILDELEDQEVSSPKPLLTRRERQVAALVPQGRTNRQIARALGISEKTVEVHVHHIMGKLGASSRAEVAAWCIAERAPAPAPGSRGFPQ
ncbi:ATP-binding protein [Rhodococcus sp. NPDC059234]|uniref:ATP-binding protein n=1 Tax=Rhodococcus sp. NPDC059234 TaxID=3346781 RepID=UPI00366B807F